MKEELQKRGETGFLLNELVRNDFRQGFLPHQEIVLAAPNKRIKAYRVEAPEKPLFVKVYTDFPEEGHTEFTNYQYFASLPFIPKLEFYDLNAPVNRQVFAYEFIEGQDLHTEFSDAREQDVMCSTDPILQVLDQTGEMASVLMGHEDEFTNTPWALRTPVRDRFLPSEEDELFLSAYSSVLIRNSEVINIMPGFYFDRNPRNILLSQGNTYQIDFGVIERSSPIFDLAKLIRNGVDVARPVNAENFLDLGAFTSEQEEFIKDYFYQTKVDPTILSKDQFDLYFHHAALHTHIFYLTKYLRMLRDNEGESEVLAARSLYHVGMGHRTIHSLTTRGEQVDHLHAWLEHFVQLSRSS